MSQADQSFRPLNVVPEGFSGASRFVHVVGSDVWVDDSTPSHGWTAHFIGLIDGQGWWAIDVPRGADPASGAAVDLRSFHARVPEHHWLAAGRAVQIVEWARTNRFCGRCGEATAMSASERSMRCPRCALLAFPRLSPAMITLVTRGEPGPDQEALLARGAQFTRPMYSCLAGFVEPGESLEAAVLREVLEEVGLVVRNPTYFASQPWPFPNSLMVGFTAQYESGDIVCDPVEIVDAGWYRRDNIPMIPPGISIARKLIDRWLLT